MMGVGDTTGHVHEGEVAELPVRAIEARGQLRRELEYEARAFGGDLPEARVGHLGKLTLVAVRTQALRVGCS